MESLGDIRQFEPVHELAHSPHVWELGGERSLLSNQRTLLVLVKMEALGYASFELEFSTVANATHLLHFLLYIKMQHF